MYVHSPLAVGVSEQWPTLSRSRIRANALPESNRGRQHHSIDARRETSAALWQSPDQRVVTDRRVPVRRHRHRLPGTVCPLPSRVTRAYVVLHRGRGARSVGIVGGIFGGGIFTIVLLPIAASSSSRQSCSGAQAKPPNRTGDPRRASPRCRTTGRALPRCRRRRSGSPTSDGSASKTTIRIRRHGFPPVRAPGSTSLRDANHKEAWKWV